MPKTILTEKKEILIPEKYCDDCQFFSVMGANPQFKTYFCTIYQIQFKRAAIDLNPIPKPPTCTATKAVLYEKYWEGEEIKPGGGEK